MSKNDISKYIKNGEFDYKMYLENQGVPIADLNRVTEEVVNKK